MKPGCSTSRAKMEKNALNHQKWLPDSSQDPSTQNPSQIFSNFGSLPRAQKTIPNRLFPEKAVPGSVFLSIFAANVVVLDFLIDFGLNYDEKSMRSLMIFPGRSLIFSNMATLTKHCILQLKHMFPFSYFISFAKSTKKTTEVWTGQKSRKNDLLGIPKWTKNH